MRKGKTQGFDVPLAHFEAACTCGISVKITAPEITVAYIRALWEKRHTGKGHQPGKVPRKVKKGAA